MQSTISKPLSGYSFPARSSKNNNNDHIRASRPSESSDPFKYDREIQHIAAPSISSIADLSTAGDRNKELPPAPASSPQPQPQVPIEYVQALHDYASAGSAGSNVCLSFTAGQLIRVLNKDPSGWWDGEIDGIRGWFPSNYVTEESDASTSALTTEASSESSARAEKSSVAMQRGASAPLAATHSSSMTVRPDSPFEPSRRASDSDSITSSITHAISLMQKAVEANRSSHFQPATTCLIAAVRSVLSATDCLTRESVILRTHLILARERKQILSILANLVTQARNAASATEQALRAQETDGMLQMADSVLRNVEHFLQTAMRCGVSVPTKIDEASLVADEQQSSERITRLQDVSTPNLDACLQFTDFGSAGGSELAFNQLSSHSSSGKLLHKARSFGEIKSSRRKGSEASTTSTGTSASSQGHGSRTLAFLSKPPSPPHLTGSNNAPSMSSMLRRPSIPAAYATSLPSPAWAANDSLSSSASSSFSSSLGPLTPFAQGSMPQPPVEVYRALSLIHDQLLSTIAAFVGHIHAHSRSSHSSSYAHLIDMARDIIERVREALCIVDVVSKHPALQCYAKDLKMLSRHREGLYVVTTALVTAARQATTTSTTPLDLADEARVHEQEEDEKQDLLKAATGILRASADCVNSTKPVLLKKNLDGVTFVLDLLQPALSRSESSSTEGPLDEDATLQVTDSGIGSEDNTMNDDGNRAGVKGRHTVSMLARKVTSLTCLRGQYEQDGESHDESTLEEEGAEEERDDSVARHRLGEWQQRQREQQANAGLPQQRRNASARSSMRLSASFTPSEDTQLPERSESSLSARRGVPVPSSLTIVGQRPLYSPRPPSFGAMSATSTITSLSREKAHTPAPILRSLNTSGGPSSTPSPSSAGSSNLSYKAGGEAMSRDESSRGSATSTATSSFRSVFSDANTADTSPRSSVAFPSPAEEKADWMLFEQATNRRPSRPEVLRARSGSTPDRLTALRTSELPNQPGLPSPLSPRPPVATSPNETSSPKGWLLERDYQAKECAFNANGNVTGGTLQCLVERMTLHDQTIDASFSNTFFLTFRMFTNPLELTEALFARFNITPPAGTIGSDAELKLWRDQKLVPVRLRIYNFFKTWLEGHWRPDVDSVILEPLTSFTREYMQPTMAAAAQRLIDLIQKRSILNSSHGPGRPRGLTRMASAEKLKAGKPVSDGQALGSATFPGSHSVLPPSPIVSKALLSALRTPPFAPTSILDFDPLELARQFTIMESRLYCLIQAEELIGQEFGKKSTNRMSNIRAMSSLSTRMTGWIAEIILSELDAKKRTALVKYFIKVGDRCLSLQNFNTLMAILAALNSSTIARLKKTWEGLSNKYKTILEVLRKSTECSRNYAEYRANVRAAVAPCLPFVGLYLTDITFCYDGNPSHRSSPLDGELRLINFDRYQKIAKIVGDLQRFQQPYNLVEVTELQSFLHTAMSNVDTSGDPQALYRRSLMIEPRQNPNEQGAYNTPMATTPNPASGRDVFWRL